MNKLIKICFLFFSINLPILASLNHNVNLPPKKIVSLKWKIKKDNISNGQIDWDKFHRARKKMKDHKKDRRNKERYRKDELSDDEKEDLK